MVNSVHMVFTCCSHAFHRACPSSELQKLSAAYCSHAQSFTRRFVNSSNADL